MVGQGYDGMDTFNEFGISSCFGFEKVAVNRNPLPQTKLVDSCLLVFEIMNDLKVTFSIWKSKLKLFLDMILGF